MIGLLARPGAPLGLPGVNVTKPGLFYQLLNLPAVLNGGLNIRRQLVRHVNGEALVSSIAGQGVTTVADACCTR